MAPTVRGEDEGGWAVPRWLRDGLPLLCVLFFFANALLNGFAVDDHHFVQENAAVAHPTWSMFWRATNTGGGAFFRPLGVASLALDHAFWNGNAAGFHLSSIVIHLAATFVVTRLASLLIGDSAGLFAGLLFAVHPVHTEAVTNIANRPEVLATFFCTCALLVFWRERRAGSLTSIAIENGLFFAGLLSKESAVTLPAVFFAAAVLIFRRPRPWLAPLSLLPALGGYLLLRHNALGGLTYAPEVGHFFGVPWETRVFTVLTFLPQYARLLVVPITLSADYSRNTLPDVATATFPVWAGMAIGVGALIGVVRYRRRSPVAALGLAMIIVGLLPYLHLTVLGPAIAERFLYWPSVGAALLGGVLFGQAQRWLPRPRMGFGLAAALTGAFGLVTAERNLDWRDDLTLWEATVQTVPHSRVARAYLGIEYCKRGEIALGLPMVERGYAFSQSAFFLMNLASCVHDGGMFARALELNILGQKRFPTDPSFRHGALIARIRLGDPGNAFNDAVELLRLERSPRAFALVQSVVSANQDPAALLRARAQVSGQPLRADLLTVLSRLHKSHVNPP